MVVASSVVADSAAAGEVDGWVPSRSKADVHGVGGQTDGQVLNARGVGAKKGLPQGEREANLECTRKKSSNIGPDC